MAPSLAFTVRRQNPELVSPAAPTPHEFKPLSDIDDQPGLRFFIDTIYFYRHHPSMTESDPARVIREALAKTLVFYHPLAGRLREGRDGKLIVECNGAGIVFVEADADVRLEEFGDELKEPFPCLDELIYVGGSLDGVVGCPLLLIQVTRLKCGGFIFTCRVAHTMADAPGLLQFLNAVAEIARGSDGPSVKPTWAREVLTACNPPRITHNHPEYHEVPVHDGPATVLPTDRLIRRSFLFGPKEISVLRSRLPHRLRPCSRFVLLAACVWRCRSIALHSDPSEQVRVLFSVNGRGKNSRLLPKGYYGNAFVHPVAGATVGELESNPLSYAAELVQKAKDSVTEGYILSVANLMVIRGRPFAAIGRNTYMVSDVTGVGFDRLDFGWGRPSYGGSARPVAGTDCLSSFFTGCRGGDGEERVLVPVCLPEGAMGRFAEEMEKMLAEPAMEGPGKIAPRRIQSNL